MRNLLEFLSRHNHWFVFLLLEVVGLVLLFQYSNYHASVWISSANAVTGKVMEADAWVTSFFHMRGENEALTVRNLQLEQEVLALRNELDAVHRRDTTLQDRSRQVVFDSLQTIPAKVVGNSVHRVNNMMTIDRGEADGVKADMGVACGTGVVGIVYLTSAHYAVVLPVLNEKSNISCAIQGRGYFGYLHWNGGLTNEAYLDDVPRHAKFELGDTIVTSGYSSVFPGGLMVGTVTEQLDSRDGLSYRLKVQLATDYAQLRNVSVIRYEHRQEQAELEQKAAEALDVDVNKQ